MTRRAVVLGAGTGGTLVANRLRRSWDPAQLEIVVIDQDDRHLYQPGLLFVPFGDVRSEDLVRPRQRQLRDGIAFNRAAVDHVSIDPAEVVTGDGRTLPYDVLVIATGSTLLPEETEGLLGPGWLERVFTFYTPDGADSLAAALARFESGHLVVNIIDLPIKCPVAPLEFLFLADAYFEGRCVRDRVQLTFATPLDGAFTKPIAASRLGGLLERKGIELVTEFNTSEVDGTNGLLRSYDGRTVDFDLAVVVPLHGGAAYIAQSPGLGDELNFVPTDPHTLQSKAAPNVFVIGDAADLPTSKAGSVAHFAGEVLVENVGHFLRGEPLDASFDGHTNCFIESGHGRALLIDFDYDTEPLPGHFPGPVGLPLLKESRLNHLGKLAFEPLYWHVLLPGHELPMLGPGMPRRGKRPVATGRTFERRT